MSALGHIILIAMLACIASTPVRAAVQTASDEGRAGGEAVRPRLVVQLGFPLRGSAVHCLAYHPDGRLIFVGGLSPRLWDAVTGNELRRFEGTSDSVVAAAFSPDGRWIAVAPSFGIVRFYDVATGEEVRRLDRQSQSVSSIAFSPDGRYVLTGNWGRTASVWNVATGVELRRFEGHEDRVLSVACSPDGRFVATGSWDRTARLWDTETGREVWRFEGHSDVVTTVGFSPDGRFVLTGSPDNTARLWDVETGREARRFQGDLSRTPCPDSYYRVRAAYSPDGRFVLSVFAYLYDTNAIEYDTRLWDATTGEEVRRYADGAEPVAFSPDGRFISMQGPGSVQVVEAATGAEAQRLRGYSDEVSSVAYSPDGRHIFASTAGSVRVWDATAGVELRSLGGFVGSSPPLAPSPDGRVLLTGGQFLQFWDVATGAEARRFAAPEWVHKVAYSPDGRFIVTVSLSSKGADRKRFSSLRLRDAATGSTLWSTGDLPDWIRSVALSPDGRLVLAGWSDKTARLLDAATGKEVRRFAAADVVDAVAFSPDGRLIAVGVRGAGVDTVTLFDASMGEPLRTFNQRGLIHELRFSSDGRTLLVAGAELRLWETETGKSLRAFRGHAGSITSAAFSPDGRVVLAGSPDGATRLWDRETGRELCQLISFVDGTWAVVDPEGRFDTNSLDEVRGLHWVMPDDPFTALPVEVFARDYYEPGLLARILAGERFAPVRDLSSLNRVQPRVRILDVRPSPGAPDEVAVRVEVAKASRPFARNGSTAMRETGVFDLRLFRDGQLVGSAPEPGGEVAVDPATGTAVVTFASVKLPRTPGRTHGELSAYAFNVDRIKSATDRRVYEVPKGLSPVKGRAYVVSVGVNAYDDPRLDLRFAVNDARRVRGAVAKRLARLGQFDEVVSIELLSDYRYERGRRVVASRGATKANVKAVLDLLSGKAVDPELAKQIPNADRIRPARPEDLVLVSFSSHGVVDERGEFYVVPSDIGPSAAPRVMAGSREIEHAAAPAGIPAELLARSISSEELGRWLRDVDAGEMVMIVDACYAAASVEGKGFKPGPMGSRGLGQLAYDKGMRIVAATQADNVALEVKSLEEGLLSFALTQEGLEAGRADFKPKDARIMLAEWLAYGVERVPSLYAEARAGTVAAVGGERPRLLVVEGVARAKAPERVQRPAMFDFARGRADVALTQMGQYALERDGLERSGPLPESADLRASFVRLGLEPRGQAGRPTTSVFVVAGALEYALSRRGARSVRLSVEYLNWACNQIIGNRTEDRGQFFHDILAGFERYGACAEELMPYRPRFEPGLEPSAEARRNAEALRDAGLRVHWIKRWSPKPGLADSHLAEIKAALANGWPVGAGSSRSVVLLVGYRDDPAQPGGGRFMIGDPSNALFFRELTYSFVMENMADVFWVESPDRAVGSSGR